MARHTSPRAHQFGNNDLPRVLFLPNGDPKPTQEIDDTSIDGSPLPDPGTLLDYRRVDEVWNAFEQTWVPCDARTAPKKTVDKYQGFSFTVIRKYQIGHSGREELMCKQ
jgi:hypothetical protein